MSPVGGAIGYLSPHPLASACGGGACRPALGRLVPVAQLTGDQRATRSWRHGALSELVYTPRRSTVTS